MCVCQKVYSAERLKYFSDRKKEDEEYFYDILENFERNYKDKKEINKYKTFLSAVIKSYKIGDLTSVKEELIFCNQFENKQTNQNYGDIEFDFTQRPAHQVAQNLR